MALPAVFASLPLNSEVTRLTVRPIHDIESPAIKPGANVIASAIFRYPWMFGGACSRFGGLLRDAGYGVVGMYGYGLLPFTVGVMLPSVGVVDGGNFFISLAFTRILGLAGVASFDKLRMIRQYRSDSAGLGWFGGCRVIGGLVLRWLS